MKKIAIIGANEFQLDLIKKAKAFGVETHVFSWGGGDPGEEIADFFYEISIVDKEAILEVCQRIGVDGVCTIASDLANITVHWVAGKMGLPAHNQETIDVSTNKFLMRERFARDGVPIPFYKILSCSDDISDNALPEVAIVKPIDRSGSRGITKISSMSELDEAIRYSQESSFTKDVLIEEFVDGREFSVESISSNGQHKVLQITEKFTTGNPHYIEVAHLAPARLSTEQQHEIRNVTLQVLDSIGIQFGASHTELKINSQGNIYVIEVGSRMGGDFIGSYMVESNTGVDFVTAVLRQSLGEELSLESLDVRNNEKATLVYYQVTPDAQDISQHSGVRMQERLVNQSYADATLGSSGDRYACMKLTVEVHQLQDVLKIIEDSYGSL